MRIDAVGLATDPVVQTVDRRWLLAYAASVGSSAPALTDTRRPGGVVAHPLFAVAVEWRAVLAAQRLVPPQDDLLPGVHATHDLVLHRPIREGDTLATVATIEDVSEQRYGVLQVLRLDTVDDAAQPVATTRMGLAFRPASPQPPHQRTGHLRTRKPMDSVPSFGEADEVVASELRLPRGLAHAYTECSRIWNPIHTDPEAARAAGLAEPILHGTCTLAVVVSRILHSALDGDPTRVAALRARFAAPVTLPAVLKLRHTTVGERIELTAARDDGRVVLADGVVDLGPSRSNL